MGQVSTDGAAENPEPVEGKVAFAHKFFTSMPDLAFLLDEESRPVISIDLGGGKPALLGFDGVKKEFGIQEEEPDGLMLAKIAEALRFVRGLRVGDELPKEVTTGEASWSVSEKNLRTARQRLTLQLVTWLTGEEHVFSTPEELVQLAEDPSIKRNVILAFEEAAVEIGLGKARKDEVVGYIETLAAEMAHIEWERDVFADIVKIDVKVQEFRRLYSSDKGMNDTVVQTARLMNRARGALQTSFDEIDAQTGEVVSMLRNVDAQILYIRGARNDLYVRLTAWEEILLGWRKAFTVRSEENVALLRDLYRFLAPRYMQTKEWILMGKLQANAKKPYGGSLRW